MPRIFFAVCGGAFVLAAASAPASAQSGASDSRSPEEIALQTAVERVCLPVLRGRKMTELVSSAELRRKEDGWQFEASGGPIVQITPPTTVNPHVCSMHLKVTPGDVAGLTGVLDQWSQARGLHPVKVGDASRGPFKARTTWTWEGSTSDGALALVFDLERNLDGSPVNGANATALVSLTPL